MVALFLINPRFNFYEYTPVIIAHNLPIDVEINSAEILSLNAKFQYQNLL